MKNSTILNLEVTIQSLEAQLEGALIQLNEYQTMLDDESISDELWDELKSLAIKAESKRMDINSKLAAAKCELRVAEKIA
ncbi:hypothetical protein VPHK460_0157 [Vibrio phage K460]